MSRLENVLTAEEPNQAGTLDRQQIWHRDKRGRNRTFVGRGFTKPERQGGVADASLGGKRLLRQPAAAIVGENLRPLYGRPTTACAHCVFHPLILPELPRPCLSGVTNTDTFIRSLPELSPASRCARAGSTSKKANSFEFAFGFKS